MVETKEPSCEVIKYALACLNIAKQPRTEAYSELCERGSEDFLVAEQAARRPHGVPLGAWLGLAMRKQG